MLRPSLCSMAGHICQPHSGTLGLRAPETPDSSCRELWGLCWSLLQRAETQGRWHRWDAALPAMVTVISVPMAARPLAALFHWLPHPPVPTCAHPHSPGDSSRAQRQQSPRSRSSDSSLMARMGSVGATSVGTGRALNPPGPEGWCP